MEEINQLSPDESKQILKLPNSWREMGQKEGIQEGIQEGFQKGIRKTALEMLKEGLSVDLIAKVTHLGLADIEELKRTL